MGKFIICFSPWFTGLQFGWPELNKSDT